jgi:CDP-glycerol glycerophosphotransferase
MEYESDNDNAEKNRAMPRLSQEERIAVLEQSILRINQFNQAVTTALTQTLERLKDMESVAEWGQKLDSKIERQRSVATLARASRLFPKSRTVVFVGRSYFGDNAKYAYLAFCKYARDKNIAVHYLTDDEHQRELLLANGLPCLPCDPDDWSLDDVNTLFRAKAVVLSDNFHPFAMKSPKAYGMLQGAKTIQLWHGIPIKKIGLHYLLRADHVLLEELIASSGMFDVFVAPAVAARGDWAQMFAFRDFAAIGYPRTDVLFREPAGHDLLNTDGETIELFANARRAGKSAILYTPTYRDDEGSNWFDKAGIDKFAAHARDAGHVLAVNLHPFEQHALDKFRERYPDIHFVAASTDIYPVLRHVDVLVTDYSSLAFDYLLLDRPLVFYRPDHEYYMNNERGFIPGRERITPGAVASSLDDLFRAVDAAVNFARAPATDPSRIARHELRGRLFDHVDGDAAQRLCECIAAVVDAE